HPLSVVDRSAISYGLKELDGFCLIHFVLFAFVSPAELPGKCENGSAHADPGEAPASKHFDSVTIRAVVMLTAEVVTSCPVGIFVFDRKMVVDISEDGIGTNLSPT